MSSNYFDLGLDRRSPQPWLRQQLGGTAQPSPLDYSPPQGDDHASSNVSGPQGSRTSAIGQPKATTQQAERTPPPDAEPQAPKVSSTAKFWQGVLGAIGQRHPIAAVLGSLGTAKANAEQDQYGQDRQAWLDRQKLSSDQARIGLEDARSRRQDALAAKSTEPVPNWKTMNYETAMNAPASGVGPVLPKQRGIVTYDEHSKTPPAIPEGAQPLEKPDTNVTAFEAWHAQHPNADPLDFVRGGQRPQRETTHHWTARDVDEPDPKDPTKTRHGTQWYDASADRPPDAAPPKHEKAVKTKRTLADELRGDATPPPDAAPAVAAAAPKFSHVTKDGKLGWDGKAWVPTRR